MSLNNSLITKLRESSLTVNEQSCLRGQRVYGQVTCVVARDESLPSQH